MITSVANQTPQTGTTGTGLVLNEANTNDKFTKYAGRDATPEEMQAMMNYAATPGMDHAGLNSWIENTLLTSGVPTGTTLQQPAVTTQPTASTPTSVVEGMYQSLLGREGAQSGIDFWSQGYTDNNWTPTQLEQAMRDSVYNTGSGADYDYLFGNNTTAPTTTPPPVTTEPATDVNTLAMQALTSAGEATSSIMNNSSFTPVSTDYNASNVTAGQLANTDLSAYMNPYEQSVVDQTLKDMEEQRLMQQNSMDAAAGAAGAFGGSRHGIVGAETNLGFADQFAKTAGDLRYQGFTNAQNQAGLDLNMDLQAQLANQGAGLSADQLSLQAQLANQTGGLSADQQSLAAAGQLASIGNLGFGMGQQLQDRMDAQGLQQQALNQSLINAAQGQYAGYTGQPAAGLGYVAGALGAAPVPQTQTSGYNPGLFDYLTLGASLAPSMMGMM